MQWSQLKKRIEEGFAPAVKGRVAIWASRYRRGHDQPLECWITLDGQMFLKMADFTYAKAYYGLAARLHEEGNCQDYQDPQQRPGYFAALEQAEAQMLREEIFAPAHFWRALEEFLNTSIQQALHSDNLWLRAVALLDRRCGLRRLRQYDPTTKYSLEQRFYALRCALEGLSVSSPGR